MFINTAIGGGGSSPDLIASTYSLPDSRAPAAAAGSGSCQVIVLLREVPGERSAKRRAESTALPSAPVPTALNRAARAGKVPVWVPPVAAPWAPGRGGLRGSPRS